MKTKIKSTQIIFLIIIVLFFPAVIYCQEYSTDTVYVTSPKFDETKYWDSKPISELPAHIPIYKDIMYLYADFENIKDGAIPIYIINNTPTSFEYDSQKMELLQQEFKDSDSIWRRSASFYHVSSCVVLLRSDGIRPFEFLLISDFVLKKGEEYDARYRFFNTDIVTSNIGKAKINLEDAEVARYDDIALRASGADFLNKIIKGEIAPFETHEKNDELIWRALFNITSYYPDEAIPVLSVLAKDYASKFCEYAMRILESLKKRKQEK
ncbi:MAG: hypothetical protein IPM56_17950 [Ignavibacteriales bacterium]|nr:MAG: hypothetical protein IPM56_17950 [Ignavibacteriales bacterium]